MKDIEDLLRQHTPEPQRSLADNFTQTVISQIRSQQRPSRRQALLGNLTLPHLSRVGFVSLASILLISGTAAAIALWPTPHVTPTITKSLPSGNHIVGVDAENCQYLKALDGTANQPGTDKLYYEVRQGSTLTDQQIIDTVQGVCEENISNNAISAIMKQLQRSGTPGGYSSLAYTVEAMTDSSLTVSPDPHYTASLYSTVPHLTYHHFSKDLLVYDKTDQASYADIRVGDTIKMIVQDTSGLSSETPEHANPFNHPETLTILAILKIPALTTDPDTFYTSVGKDIVRVEPCSSSPSGFCRTYEFSDDNAR